MTASLGLSIGFFAPSQAQPYKLLNCELLLFSNCRFADFSVVGEVKTNYVKSLRNLQRRSRAVSLAILG
jgi:hypothetical protein